MSGGAALSAYTHDIRDVLCGISAAHLWQIPLPAWAQDDWRIHLARSRWSSQPRRGNIVGHRLTIEEDEIHMLDGARLTSPARTWLDLAAQLPLDDLVVATDYLLCAHGPEFPRPRTPICLQPDLEAMVLRNAGRRGVRKSRAAIELGRVGADSPPETIMRLALLRAGLPEPELNMVLYDDSGVPAIWPDAAYPLARVALQYDGRHHGDEQQYRRDIQRTALTRSLGWTELRISSADLTGERPAVVRKVRDALRPIF